MIPPLPAVHQWRDPSGLPSNRYSSHDEHPPPTPQGVRRTVRRPGGDSQLQPGTPGRPLPWRLP